jgi:hypothetical protein
MSIIRENYYAPLFALVAASATFKIASRRVRLMETMEDSELPAIFMSVDHQPTTPSINEPAKYKLGAKVFLYCAVPDTAADTKTSAAVALNGLIDALEAALEPAPGFGSQNLGRDDVQGAWISGDVEVFDAPNGTRAAAIVPIQIHVFG